MNERAFKINRKNIFRVYNLSLFTFILLWFYPINYGLIRLAIITLCISLYLLSIYLLWHRQIIRFSLITLLTISILFLTLPGKPIEIEPLRLNYLSQLNKYENTNYIWGGENKIGIDCSGLVRKGLIEASFKEGILAFNPNLIRSSFDLWWHDSSAKALRDEYRNYTKKLFLSDSINQIDYSKINPGDMAATKDGVHILAYLGDRVWIEADPIYKKVIKVRVPEPNNPWFNTPIYILRWQQLID